jgi:hypothetical protein
MWTRPGGAGQTEEGKQAPARDSHHPGHSPETAADPWPGGKLEKAWLSISKVCCRKPLSLSRICSFLLSLPQLPPAQLSASMETHGWEITRDLPKMGSLLPPLV